MIGRSDYFAVVVVVVVFLWGGGGGEGVYDTQLKSGLQSL